MTQTGKTYRIDYHHTPGTTMRYHVTAHHVLQFRGTDEYGDLDHATELGDAIPESWLREIGVLARDESTTDLSREEAKNLAAKISRRITVGRGWPEKYPDLS